MYRSNPYIYISYVLFFQGGNTNRIFFQDFAIYRQMKIEAIVTIQLSYYVLHNYLYFSEGNANF